MKSLRIPKKRTSHSILLAPSTAKFNYYLSCEAASASLRAMTKHQDLWAGRTLPSTCDGRPPSPGQDWTRRRQRRALGSRIPPKRYSFLCRRLQRVENMLWNMHRAKGCYSSLTPLLASFFTRNWKPHGNENIQIWMCAHSNRKPTCKLIVWN